MDISTDSDLEVINLLTAVNVNGIRLIHQKISRTSAWESRESERKPQKKNSNVDRSAIENERKQKGWIRNPFIVLGEVSALSFKTRTTQRGNRPQQ